MQRRGVYLPERVFIVPFHPSPFALVARIGAFNPPPSFDTRSICRFIGVQMMIEWSRLWPWLIGGRWLCGGSSSEVLKMRIRSRGPRFAGVVRA